MHRLFFREPARTLLALSLAALAAAGASCASTSAADAERSPWLAPSPSLRAQIEDEVAKMPWTHGAERVEQVRWFASVGEPAYATLLKLCVDDRPDVAGAALAALGATGDSRLVNHLHALDWPRELPRALELERARTLLRLGDWNEIDTLIAGLEDQSLWARSWCSQALVEATGQRHDFDPRGSEDARKASAERWRNWARERTAEGILAANVGG